MDMTGEFRIPASRETVWEALNNPEVLKASIPGCQELDKVGDDELTAKVKTKVGPVSATFTGKVNLTDVNPPSGYKISGEGQGGVAGFAKGGAEVSLEEDGTETILKYTAKAQVGGKLAQIGSRLIDSTAKKLANEFFTNFVNHIGKSEGPSEKTVSENETGAIIDEKKPGSESSAGISPVIWIGGLIAGVAILLVVFNAQ
ncbi:MAG: carbon monoxide dehydrogenase [Rhodospirillaceae bacterium]|nr:carbon monoxide dehydrogenase [Rhodospirillaceae bacterium]|tara:strand:+ start:799 stop:1401 length:603 start_codon:yes stop_codon:yes gene_type:complete